jgi:hypothetical protein
MLLDGFIAPNSNGRSVASVVENRLIGILGNCLVLPVAKGFDLDPTYKSVIPAKDENGTIIKDENGEIVYEYKSLLDLYQPVTPIPPMRMSVPTRGVFAESVMGKCNSCEEIDESESWVLDDSSFDLSPTAINPISTESRRSEPGNLTAKDFPTPMINIQNAPEALAPTGLAPLMQLLGTPNLFKNITGLEQNQKNALAAFQSALSASQSFAGEAAKLKIQEMLMNKMGNIRQSIQQAKKDGLITDQQANELTHSALKGLIGEKKDEKEPALVDNPQVQELLKFSGDQGKDVSISMPNGENLEVKSSSSAAGSQPPFMPSGQTSGQQTLSYNVPLIPQPNKLSCWAASMAMLLSHHRKMSISPESLAQEVGRSLRTSYGWDMLEDVKNYFGLKEIALPSNTSLYPSPQQWHEWLKTYGPLWVTTIGAPSHAIVIHGISGDLTPKGTTIKIFNPWDITKKFDADPIDFNPANYGIAYSRTFNAFAAEFGLLNLDDYGKWRILYLGK